MSARFPHEGHTDDDTLLVREAARRAKEGDMDGIRFLYARFADDVCGYVPVSYTHLTLPTILRV